MAEFKVGDRVQTTDPRVKGAQPAGARGTVISISSGGWPRVSFDWPEHNNHNYKFNGLPPHWLEAATDDSGAKDACVYYEAITSLVITHTLTLPFPLSVNQLWRASHRGGRTRVYKSPRYVSWVKAADAAWMASKPPGRPQCIEGPFRMTVTLYPPDKRHRDMDNLSKALLDTLARIELIRNDRHCRDMRVTWGEVRKTTSCCVVELAEYQP